MQHLTILLYRVDTDALLALFRPPERLHIKVLDSIRKPQNEPAFIFTPLMNVARPAHLPPKSDPDGICQPRIYAPDRRPSLPKLMETENLNRLMPKVCDFVRFAAGCNSFSPFEPGTDYAPSRV